MQQSEHQITSEMVKLVRDTIGPVAAFRKVLFVRSLPKTRSGKIPRSSLANLVNGKPYKVQTDSEADKEPLIVRDMRTSSACLFFSKIHALGDAEAHFVNEGVKNDTAFTAPSSLDATEGSFGTLQLWMCFVA